MTDHSGHFWRYVLVAVALWTIIAAVSLTWNIHQQTHATLEMARAEARTAHHRDVTYRRWSAGHGGVYVPVSEETQPNPYLAHLPERDITTPSGRLLTLINPAYMTRQVHELERKEQGVYGHITSLNPIRPQNKPDPWEAEALQAFERGEVEISSVEKVDGEDYMRLMRPLYVEASCLTCHAAQGYKLGEVRGGISVSIPMKPLWAISRKNTISYWLGHNLLWILGLTIIGAGALQLNRNMSALQESREQLRQQKEAAEVARRAAEQARAAAEAANHAKSTFLANMSHELRTPLNAILGFSQLVARHSTLTPDQQESLAIINRSGEHLLALINDVLELSKIEAGHVTLQEDVFDLHDLLDDLEEMFRLRAEDKGLSLIFDHTPDIPRYVRADESKLRQVLMNLLGNAVKFTQEGGVTLRVRSKEYEVGSMEYGVGSKGAKREVGSKEMEYGGDSASSPSLLPTSYFLLHIEVEDTGPGIASEESDALFDVFVQTESGRKSQEGTGLGLPISRQFVQLMGGDITLSSRVGHGSIFKFDVKVELADQSEIQALRPKSESALRRIIGPEPGQRAADGGPYRLLIAEDKEANRKLLVRLLAGLGFEIREAINGQEAVEIWEQWEPHLIWMDMRMPVMDGHEATRRIKATTKGQATAIVALTASVFEEDRALVLEEGCDGFVRKPFREADIIEALERNLGVRFIYEDAGENAQPETASEDVLRPEMLAALPANLLSQLHQAILEADIEAAFALIEEIHGQDAALASALADLARNFEYGRILTLTQRQTGE